MRKVILQMNVSLDGFTAGPNGELEWGGLMGTDSNKDAAVSFLKLAASGQVREAYAKFIGAGFRHHNAFFEGSMECSRWNADCDNHAEILN